MKKFLIIILLSLAWIGAFGQITQKEVRLQVSPPTAAQTGGAWITGTFKCGSIVTTTDLLNPQSLFALTGTALGSLTGCSSNGTTTLTKATHGLTPAIGDLLYITGATTAADIGFYRVVAYTAGDFTLDRAVSGTQADVACTIYGTAVSYGPTSAFNTDQPMVNWTAGVASTPAKLMRGAWFTGGSATTTKPQFLIEPYGATSAAWNTSGTGFGVNAANGFAGNLADFQLNGASKFYVTSSGSVWVKNYLYLDTGSSIIATSGMTLTINGYQGTFTSAGPGVKINTPQMSGFTASTGFNVSSTNTKSANAHNVFSITPTYNQTSTAGGTDILINRTETAVGSAPQYLIDAQTGGASKFSVTNGGLVTNGVKAITIPDSADGNPAAYTLNPDDMSVAAGALSSYVELTCSDADGCNITMGETGALVGTILNVINVGANVCNFADTAGVSELAGAFAEGQWDSLSLRYATSTWVETGRSNN